MSINPPPVEIAELPEAGSSSHCDSNSLTDSYGLAIQLILAGLAFGSLILKRFYCEPREQRRTWTVWFFDTSKQAVGAGVIHFLNVFLAQILHQKRGDPCTWYVVSFLLDSTMGLLIIYAGVRLVSFVASRRSWPTLKFGEYGKPPKCQAWFHQCLVFVGIIIVEKIMVTIMLEFRFWRHVREIILSPITNPKLEVTIVMLIIPFFMNTLIFWVVDNFTMRKVFRPIPTSDPDDACIESGGLKKKYRKKAVRTYVTENAGRQDGGNGEDSDSGEHLLPNNDEVFMSVTLETVTESSIVAKENDGLLMRMDSDLHQRHNSGSIL